MVTPGPPPQLGPGSVFGPYRIDSVIATGRAGTVLLASDQRLGRSVALKVVQGPLASSPGFVERFEREAATLAGLESPHVVQVFDHGVQDGLPFIVTQYASGGDLGSLLQRLGPMPLPLAARAVSQVAEALRDAHRAGVVHRNLKPSNVLLRDDRLDRIHVLVCDFGGGPAEGGSQATEPASAPGSWDYLAPERIQGQPASPAADVYAAGCLLHAAVTGRPPYTGTDVEVASAHLGSPVPQLGGSDDATRQLNQILARCLAKDPAQRYASAGELRDELRSFAGILSTPSQPSGPVAPAFPPPPPPPPSSAAPTMLPGAAPFGAPAGPPSGPPSGPPAGPPVYQSMSVPQGPPYGATAAGPAKKSRTPLIIAGAAAAALLLVIGIVVAVVAGGDDEPEARPSDPPTSAEQTEATTDVPEPTEPESSEPTEDTPVTPDTSGAIRGDIDGDGFGDLAVLDVDGLQVFPSNGTSGFGDMEVRRNRQGLQGVAGDVDNDGTTDLVRIQGDPPRMSAVVSIQGSKVSPLNTPSSPDIFSALDVPISLGDADGDGNLDLVLLTRVNPSTAQVDVALGDGTGAFAPTTTWFTGELPSDSATFVLADLDGDGPADLLYNYSDDETAEPLAVLLKSDGAAFTVEGEPFGFDNGGYTRDSLRVGDFDGDGSDDVMVYASYGPALSELSYEEGAFTQTPWFDNSDTLDTPSGSGWVASDVNGDSLDDIVTVGADDNLDPIISAVYLSDGSAFTAALDWARPMPKDVTGYPILDQRSS